MFKYVFVHKFLRPNFLSAFFYRSINNIFTCLFSVLKAKSDLSLLFIFLFVLKTLHIFEIKSCTYEVKTYF